MQRTTSRKQSDQFFCARSKQLNFFWHLAQSKVLIKKTIHFCANFQPHPLKFSAGAEKKNWDKKKKNRCVSKFQPNDKKIIFITTICTWDIHGSWCSAVQMFPASPSPPTQFQTRCLHLGVLVSLLPDPFSSLDGPST